MQLRQAPVMLVSERCVHVCESARSLIVSLYTKSSTVPFARVRLTPGRRIPLKSVPLFSSKDMSPWDSHGDTIAMLH
eukprot:1967366-Prymnesium_polylepis.1